ncbi:MAG: hypothetical protein C5S52_04505 [ANME-2 cluster archaeon]|nr:hypothetical protein [ANME-2 cluster archaeon]
MFSKVHDRISTEPAGSLLLLKPEIERDVLVVRRDILAMIQHSIVLEPATRRLWRKNHVSEGELRDHEILFSCRLVLPRHDLSGRLAPPLVHLFLPLIIEFAEPSEIRFDRDQGCCSGFNESFKFAWRPCPDVCSIKRHHPDKLGLVWNLAFNGVP